MMRNLIIFMLLSVTFVLAAEIPPGYYDGTEGMSGDALRAALNDIIDGHTMISYSAVWNALKETDKDPDNPDNVILLYTGWSVSNSGYPIWNREHVWAKSHGDFGTGMGAGTDLHHMKPTDVDVNSARGNKDFDNGGVQHPVATGCYYDNDSWEPRDEVKGDVARMIFYMDVRYEGENGEIDLVAMDAVNTSPLPQHGKLSTLLEWNGFDPPDEFEENRNDIIYEDYQGNRNPFIDHPNFANLIWGELEADFSAEPLSGNAPLQVQFTDLSSGSATIISWKWDFDNDGNIDSEEQNPSHIYQNGGTFSVFLRVEDEYGLADSITQTDLITVNTNGVQELPAADFAMSNYPNPFNPSTTITLNVPQTALVTNIEIYNLKGQKVRTLPVSPSQNHTVSIVWNGTDDNDKPVSAGIYLYKLNITQSPIKKMLLLK